MDVFKTRPGIVEHIMIDERNFIDATNGRRPYRMVNEHGGLSYFAVCPECDNPIQIVGLFKQEQDSRGRRPYGRHYPHDVPGLCRYDEDAYLHCMYADPSYRRVGGRRRPKDPTGLALYRTMRDEYDHVVRSWEAWSGIHLSLGYAADMLGLWRSDEGWRYYHATYRNLPQMLFYAAGAQNLYGRWVRRGSPLCGALGTAGRVELAPTGNDRWMQARTRGRGFANLSFLLCDRDVSASGEETRESFALRTLVDDRRAFDDIRLETDPDWLAHARGRAAGRRDGRLLDIARRVLA